MKAIEKKIIFAKADSYKEAAERATTHGGRACNMSKFHVMLWLMKDLKIQHEYVGIKNAELERKYPSNDWPKVKPRLS